MHQSPPKPPALQCQQTNRCHILNQSQNGRYLPSIEVDLPLVTIIVMFEICPRTDMSTHPSSLEVAPPVFQHSGNSKFSKSWKCSTIEEKKILSYKLRALQRPPWSNLREKLRTAALCNLGRIWVKNWGQMAVRCRHREWVAVKWQLYIVLCNFYTFSTPLMQYSSILPLTIALLCIFNTALNVYSTIALNCIALQCKGGCTEREPHIVQFFSIAGL